MNIVGYARLSRDEDKENYSSIESQQEMINQYCLENFNCKPYKIYVDDNYSGYTFNRPDFKEMHNELNKGNIDIIICKDLSRIGRHNARTLLFIEEVQEIGKRLILPEQGRGYDSDKDDGETLGIDTWVNERYIKDTSRKIRNSIKTKQKTGAFIIKDCFGYIKNPNNRHQYIIDESTSWIVKLIFDLYINGIGSKKIAMHLTQKNIPTPSQVVQRNHDTKGEVFKNTVSPNWYSTLVRRILKNDIYIGTLRLNKTKKLSIKGKSVRNSEGEQFIFENNHEPIINIDDFELAQRISNKRVQSKSKGGRVNDYLFTGIIYCGDCGKPMIGHTNQHGNSAYICSGYHNFGKKICSSHRIKENNILDKVLLQLEDTIEIYKEKIESLKLNSKQTDYTKVIKKILNQKRVAQEELKNILIQKTKDMMRQTDEEMRSLIEQTYMEIEKEKQEKVIAINQQLKELESITNNTKTEILESTIRIFENTLNKGDLNKKDIEIIINKIIVYEDSSIDIELNDKYEKLIKLEETA